MRDEFLITRQGKQYVLFAGLLDEAHSQGLKAIDTALIQVPSSGNGNVAIVKAVAYMADKEPASDQTVGQLRQIEDQSTRAAAIASMALQGARHFSGIGDASPENVGRNIVPHIIRMAETRAKARALRDATNIGVTAFEELGDGEEEPANSPTQPRRSDSTQGPQGLATRKQLNYLEALTSEQEEGVEGFEKLIGKPRNELTTHEASEWIGRLSGTLVERNPPDEEDGVVTDEQLRRLEDLAIRAKYSNASIKKAKDRWRNYTYTQAEERIAHEEATLAAKGGEGV